MKRGASASALSPRDRAQVGPRILKPPSSAEYAWQTCALLKTLWQNKQLSAEQWERVLAEAEEHRIYEHIPPNHPYGSLDALLKAEIGVTKAQSRQAIQAAKNKAKHGELADKGRLTEEERAKSYNITFRRGTDATYLARRLKRDHPDIFVELEHGAYRSVYAAAKAAGLVKIKSPLEDLLCRFRKLTPEDRAQFLAIVNGGPTT